MKLIKNVKNYLTNLECNLGENTIDSLLNGSVPIPKELIVPMQFTYKCSYIDFENDVNTYTFVSELCLVNGCIMQSSELLNDFDDITEVNLHSLKVEFLDEVLLINNEELTFHNVGNTVLNKIRNMVGLYKSSNNLFINAYNCLESLYIPFCSKFDIAIGRLYEIKKYETITALKSTKSKNREIYKEKVDIIIDMTFGYISLSSFYDKKRFFSDEEIVNSSYEIQNPKLKLSHSINELLSKTTNKSIAKLNRKSLNILRSDIQLANDLRL